VEDAENITFDEANIATNKDPVSLDNVFGADNYKVELAADGTFTLKLPAPKNDYLKTIAEHGALFDSPSGTFINKGGKICLIDSFWYKNKDVVNRKSITWIRKDPLYWVFFIYATTSGIVKNEGINWDLDLKKGWNTVIATRIATSSSCVTGKPDSSIKWVLED